MFDVFYLLLFNLLFLFFIRVYSCSFVVKKGILVSEAGFELLLKEEVHWLVGCDGFLGEPRMNTWHGTVAGL